METEFQKQVEGIEEILDEKMDCSVLLCKRDKEAVTYIRGNLMDEIILLNKAVNALRNDMNDHFPKPITEMLLSYITHEDEEKPKAEEPKGIPDWLKKLMNIEDSEDCEGDDGSEEEGTVPDDNSEQAALQKAVDGLAKALRDTTGADNVDVICGHVGRRKDRS